jgi:hypothetical protein
MMFTFRSFVNPAAEYFSPLSSWRLRPGPLRLRSLDLARVTR